MNFENFTFQKTARQLFEELGEEVCTRKQKELALELDISVGTLQRWLEEKGFVTIRSMQNKEIEFTDIQMSVITGSLIGDGTIDKYKFDANSKTNRNSLLRIKHSILQKDYIIYKKDLLGDIVTSIKDLDNKRLDKIHKAVEIICQRNIAFSKLRDKWYTKEGIRFVPEDLDLNPLSLAIWFMDDGSITPTGVMFAVTSLTIKDIEVLRRELFKFNIESNVWASGVIYIPARCLNRFREVVGEHICSSMQYKLGSPKIPLNRGYVLDFI